MFTQTSIQDIPKTLIKIDSGIMLNIEDAQLLKFPQKIPHKNKVPDSASHFEKLRQVA